MSAGSSALASKSGDRSTARSAATSQFNMNGLPTLYRPDPSALEEARRFQMEATRKSSGTRGSATRPGARASATGLLRGSSSSPVQRSAAASSSSLRPTVHVSNGITGGPTNLVVEGQKAMLAASRNMENCNAVADFINKTVVQKQREGAILADISNKQSKDAIAALQRSQAPSRDTSQGPVQASSSPAIPDQQSTKAFDALKRVTEGDKQALHRTLDTKQLPAQVLPSIRSESVVQEKLLKATPPHLKHKKETPKLEALKAETSTMQPFKTATPQDGIHDEDDEMQTQLQKEIERIEAAERDEEEQERVRQENLAKAKSETAAKKAELAEKKEAAKKKFLADKEAKAKAERERVEKMAIEAEKARQEAERIKNLEQEKLNQQKLLTQQKLVQEQLAQEKLAQELEQKKRDAKQDAQLITNTYLTAGQQLNGVGDKRKADVKLSNATAYITVSKAELNGLGESPTYEHLQSDIAELIIEKSKLEAAKKDVDIKLDAVNERINANQHQMMTWLNGQAMSGKK